MSQNTFTTVPATGVETLALGRPPVASSTAARPRRPIPVLLMIYSLDGAGGTERQVLEIARSLDRTRFTPFVAAVELGSSHRSQLCEAGIEALRLPLESFLSFSFLRSARLFRAFVRRHRIEIVHTFDPTTTIFACLASTALRVPCLLSSQRAYRSLSFARYRSLLHFSDRRVDGITVNCEAMRRHLIDDERAEPAKIHVCPNTIDSGRFFAPPRPSSPVLTVGTACVFREEKDLASLIKAFAVLCEKYPNLRLLLVGQGPEKPTLEKLSQDLGIHSRCQFVPRQEKVEKYLHEIDIFVLPSVSEALSNSLMEAMACGCCVIGTRVGGTPELILDGQTGLLYDPGDTAALRASIEHLIQHPDRRRELARAAGDHIRANYSRARTIGRIEQVYTAAWSKSPAFTGMVED